VEVYAYHVQPVAIYVVATLTLVRLAFLIFISGMMMMLILLMMIAYHVLDLVAQHAPEVVPAILAKMDTTKAETTASPVLHPAGHVVATLTLVRLALMVVIWMQTLAYYAPHHLANHAL
jgi:hypothetical protein